jgi:hypothetical protein
MPMVDAAAIEQEIVQRIAAAGLRLRFDKVALRLVAAVRAALAGRVADDQTVAFTVTAPIKVPTTTAVFLAGIVQGELPDDEFQGVVHGNQIRIRRLMTVVPNAPRVIGFVHNPASDAVLILSLVETWLLP